MAPPKRSKDDIIVGMLFALSAFPRNSNYSIADKVNISYSQFKKYMEFLQSKKLVIRGTDGSWIVTDKGRKYVKAYEEMMSVLGEDVAVKKTWARFAEA